MKYICKLCCYETCDFGNFSRHKQSKKHLKITENQNKVETNHIIKKDNNKLICNLCNQQFTTTANMYRHRKHHCTMRNIKDIEIQNLKKKFQN